MSRWLKNVGQFLEKLDDQAKDVVEERLAEGLARIGPKTKDPSAASDNDIDQILLARGLSSAKSDDDDDDDEEEDDEKEKDSNNMTQQQQQQNYDDMQYMSSEHSNGSAVMVAETGEEGHSDALFIDDGIAIESLGDGDGWDDIPSPGASMNHDNDSKVSEVSSSQQPVIAAGGAAALKKQQQQQQQQKQQKQQQQEEQEEEGEKNSVEEHEKSTTEEESTGVHEGEKGTKVDEHVDTDSSLEGKPRQPHKDEEVAESVTDESAKSQQEAEFVDVENKTDHPPRSNESFFQNLVNYQQDAAAVAAPRTAPSPVPQVISSEPMIPLSVMNNKLKIQESTLIDLSQKEIRKLKRHVFSLNSQLEATEKEMLEQRKELEEAADLVQTERAKNKETLEYLKTKQAADIAALKQQHDQAIREMNFKHEQKMEEVQKQFHLLEIQRKQEGGDFTKELSDAIQREKEIRQKYESVLDEKEILLSQINTMQTQQETLGMRLESLTHTADTAMEREREADRRLDEALELHAKQLTQRQAREAELEKTVAELGAALVASRNNNNNNSSSSSSNANNNNNMPNFEHDQAAGDVTSQSDQREAALQTLAQENDALKAHLTLQKERCSALENELREISKERADEAAVHNTRQKQHDNAVAELNKKISQLRTELREAKKDSVRDSVRSESGTSAENDVKRIKTLSEEVLRQREKISNYSSEISALRTRLNVALNRATVAEAAAEAVAAGGSSVDLEGGIDIPLGNRMQRRRKKDTLPSMRKALMMDSAQDGNEKIGRFLDAIDSCLVTVGRTLRVNPFARLFFVFYLLILHLWTFLLLFFHAHNFEDVHRDYNVGIPHGPEALVQQKGTKGD